MHNTLGTPTSAQTSQQTAQRTDMCVIARLGKTHGIHGWLRLYSFMQNPADALEYSSNWHISCTASTQASCDKSWQPLELEKSKPQQNYWLVKLADYNSPEAASALVNAEIAIPTTIIKALPAGEYYWHQLIGLQVITESGAVLGKICEMQETGANDVMLIQGERLHCLPYTDHTVLNTCLQKKVMTVDWDPDF